MVDFRIGVTYDGALGRIARQLGTNTTAALHQALDRSRSRVDIEVLPLVNEEPPPSDGIEPLWTSERQKRAYFATDGFGHGIPYQRSGKLLQAWKSFITLSGISASIGIVNTAPAAKFVYGTNSAILPQQFFHFVTGWEPIFPMKDKIIRAIVVIVTEEVLRLTPVILRGTDGL
jgi:hypothetical protein